MRQFPAFFRRSDTRRISDVAAGFQPAVLSGFPAGLGARKQTKRQRCRRPRQARMPTATYDLAGSLVSAPGYKSRSPPRVVAGKFLCRRGAPRVRPFRPVTDRAQVARASCPWIRVRPSDLGKMPRPLARPSIRRCAPNNAGRFCPPHRGGDAGRRLRPGHSARLIRPGARLRREEFTWRGPVASCRPNSNREHFGPCIGSAKPFIRSEDFAVGPCFCWRDWDRALSR